jgi:hypothetical protein
MPNENFRRELGHVFDEMTGSPTAALPDRVRSSLAVAPEQRGPFWIAGIAAAVIAALVIAVLVVANPLNRPTTPAGPGAGSSPSPAASLTASPTGSPSPTADASLPAFVCAGGSAVGTSPAPAVAFIDALRTGTHPGYDRLTIEFKNGPAGSVELQTQSGTRFTNSPKGDQVTLAGNNGILVVIHGSDLHTNYHGSTDIKTGYTALVEVRQVEDFEGVVQLALGLSGTTCYRAFSMTNPDRLVIDIKA